MFELIDSKPEGCIVYEVKVFPIQTPRQSKRHIQLTSLNFDLQKLKVQNCLNYYFQVFKQHLRGRQLQYTFFTAPRTPRNHALTVNLPRPTSPVPSVSIRGFITQGKLPSHPFQTITSPRIWIHISIFPDSAWKLFELGINEQAEFH